MRRKNMKYEKYLIKKGKEDLLTSLKSLDKKIIDEKLKEYDLKTIEELKDYIIEDFEEILDESSDDIFTQMYFQRLIENEKSMFLSAYEDDIESLIVFVYENGNHYSYYIPTEIKEVINKFINGHTLDEQINLNVASDTEIVKDLKENLNSLTLEDLKNIGNLLLINRLSAKSKKQTVDIIYNALTDKDKLAEIMERFIDKEYNLLQELMKNKGTIQNNNISIEEYGFLNALGIILLFQRNNNIYISITDDIYNVLKEMNLNSFKETIEKNTKVYNLTRSMVELYGVVSYQELVLAYNQYYGHNKDFDIPTDALIFSARLDNISIFDTQDNLYFVNKILDNKELETILDSIKENREKIKRKPIELDELLKHGNYDYYEDNSSIKKFKKYLKKYNISDNLIEDIIKTISNMYRLGYDFIGLTFTMLQEYGLEVSETNMQEILNYLIEIYNNTILWANNGWTPNELGKTK
jgi:hypothetical protein